ncbi:MAG: peptidyl-prolyl cis-trans isomerase [bacterium]
MQIKNTYNLPLDFNNLLLPILLITISLSILTSCQDYKLLKGKKNKNLILGEVNGEEIKLDEFNKKFSYTVVTPFALTKTVETNFKLLKKQFFEQYIENRLILQEAKKKNIIISDDALNEAINRIVKNYPNGDIKEVLAEEEISCQDWMDNLKEALLIKETVSTLVFDSINIPDEEIKAYYENNKEEFEQPEQVRVRQIVVETEKEAIDILAELKKKPGDFEKTAKEKSLSPEGKFGGDLGFFAKGQMLPEFDDAVSNLQKGQISDVRPTDYGFHIFRLIDKKTARTLTFNEAYDSMKEQLTLNKQSAYLQAWIKELKKKSVIKVNSYALTISEE